MDWQDHRRTARYPDEVLSRRARTEQSSTMSCKHGSRALHANHYSSPDRQRVQRIRKALSRVRRTRPRPLQRLRERSVHNANWIARSCPTGEHSPTATQLHNGGATRLQRPWRQCGRGCCQVHAGRANRVTRDTHLRHLHHRLRPQNNRLLTLKLCHRDGAT